MKTIPLSNSSKKAKVSDADYARASKLHWSMDKDGYAVHSKTRLHDFVRGKKTPKGSVVDHKDHNRLDDRDENLRTASKSENNRNASRRKDNHSGFKGVGKHGKNYRARILVGSKRVVLGAFPTREAAAEAYNRAAKKSYGNFAVTNKVKLSSTIKAGGGKS